MVIQLDFNGASLVLPWGFRHVSMVLYVLPFLPCCYDTTLFCFHCAFMVPAWYSHGASCFHGGVCASMVICALPLPLWCFHGTSHGASIGFPWCFHGASWCLHDTSMVLRASGLGVCASFMRFHNLRGVFTFAVFHGTPMVLPSRCMRFDFFPGTSLGGLPECFHRTPTVLAYYFNFSWQYRGSVHGMPQHCHGMPRQSTEIPTACHDMPRHVMAAHGVGHVIPRNDCRVKPYIQHHGNLYGTSRQGLL